MRDQLLDVNGIGPAKADEIMAIVGENTDDGNEWLERAYSALENGDEERAIVFLKRSK